ncbi:MAG: hydroxylamine reductase [Lagierella massiliensis]|nr:hydroxylamine reductase [Lagierella massiliensis]
MFCYQCQETFGNEGCVKSGICGKKPEVANKQDLLIWVTKGLSHVTTRLRKEETKIAQSVNSLVLNNLFTTITNANFDEDAIDERIEKTILTTQELKKELKDQSNLSEASNYKELDRTKWVETAKEVGVLSTENEDIRSLRELTIYGLKGLAAYLKHAEVLGETDEEIDAFMQRALSDTLTEMSVEELIDLVMETGNFGVKGMALLDKANTSNYGNPEITKVNIGVRNNPAILISGHDLKDMEMLLKQTEGTGVDVYTHSEMLPANYYPKFKKYEHFVGNYGSSWWNQREEFKSFNGPVLFTTNCIVPPLAEYKDRIYTTGAAGFSGCKHIPGEVGEEKDFSEIIEHAKKLNSPEEIEKGEIVGGFAHNQVMELEDKVIEAVKSGKIKKFIVMAGCDGRQKGRNYYTEFAKALPKDTVILTAGCAKYRYNKLNLGDIDGIPRVLDAGQCNDSYSLAVIALRLKEAFGLEDINELPIVYNIAWYEQKAVIVLLSLLALGVKNIHLGPTLPAFLSENVTKVLVDSFNLSSIGTIEDDMAVMI